MEKNKQKLIKSTFILTIVYFYFILHETVAIFMTKHKYGRMQKLCCIFQLHFWNFNYN